MFEVPCGDDPRVQAEILVRVKGRKTPMVLRLTRFDFIPEQEFVDWMAGADAVRDEETQRDGSTPRTVNRAVNLAMLKPFVPLKDYRVCEQLAAGQLDAIMLRWAEASSISLGELLASAPPSPGSTEAPSATTSTAEDGPGSTSDAA